MAKIILSKEIASGSIFFTINAPQAGEKVLFLNPEEGFDVTNDYENDEGRSFVNSICVLLYDGASLRPYALPLTSITGQSADLVDGTFYPQLKHKTTNDLGRRGKAALVELCKGGVIAEVEAIYPVKINKRNSNEQYSWTVVGIGAVEKQTYKSEKGVISFGGAKITAEEIINFFNDAAERATARL